MKSADVLIWALDLFFGSAQFKQRVRFLYGPRYCIHFNQMCAARNRYRKIKTENTRSYLRRQKPILMLAWKVHRLWSIYDALDAWANWSRRESNCNFNERNEPVDLNINWWCANYRFDVKSFSTHGILRCCFEASHASTKIARCELEWECEWECSDVIRLG